MLMNTDTSSFFSDLDPHGKHRDVAAAAAVPSAAAGGRSRFPRHDEDPTSAESLPSGKNAVTAERRVGGTQTQDSILWLDLGLCKALTRAVSHLGFLAPTPVQSQAIPAVLSGSDCCVRAVTGSGKTAAFVLPMLHRLLTKAPSKQSAMSSRRRYIRGLILVPSRELGVQCHEMAKQLAQFTTELTFALCMGGVSSHVQEAQLEQSPDVVIATPGRLVDLLRNYRGPHGGIDLTGVECLVLDECDKMLTITLMDQVLDIVNRIPPETRQTLLFSATMTEDVDNFAKTHLFEPKNIDIGHVALASQLRQQFVRVKVEASAEAAAVAKDQSSAAEGGKKKRTRKRGRNTHGEDDSEADTDSASDNGSENGDDDEGKSTRRKKRGKGNLNRIRSKSQRAEKNKDREAELVKEQDDAALFGPAMQEHITKTKTRYLVVLCEQYFQKKVVIFTKYRTTAHRLQKVFQCLGLPAAELQGNQLQEERFESLRKFASGEVNFLFCTDIASRGLDIKGVQTVINFDLPPTLTAYIHRVGRTARIGAIGTAVSLVHEAADADIMRKILSISGQVNDHQVASVKRRDIPENLLQEAVVRINEAFPQVRELLAAEQLEQKIALAEKLIRKEDKRASNNVLAETLTVKPTRTWCLSKAERKERDEAARKKYEREAEVNVQEAQAELAASAKIEADFLRRQKVTRKQARDKKQAARDRELEKAKEMRKKQAQKVQAGNVKALKKKKIRDARKAERAENREKKGRAAFKHGDGKKKNKKSRHRKSMKRH